MQREDVHDSSDREDVPVFSVLIAYEDFATGTHANRACDFLVANLSHEWRVTSQMWKFDVLKVPELQKMAAKDAAMANLMIISSRGDRELPADVKSWLETSLEYEGDTVALIGLFGCPPEQSLHAQATQAYLFGVAQRGHKTFFTWPAVVPFEATFQVGKSMIPLAAAVASRAEEVSRRQVQG